MIHWLDIVFYAAIGMTLLGFPLIWLGQKKKLDSLRKQ